MPLILQRYHHHHHHQQQQQQQQHQSRRTWVLITATCRWWKLRLWDRYQQARPKRQNYSAVRCGCTNPCGSALATTTTPQDYGCLSAFTRRRSECRGRSSGPPCSNTLPRWWAKVWPTRDRCLTPISSLLERKSLA